MFPIQPTVAGFDQRILGFEFRHPRRSSLVARQSPLSYLLAQRLHNKKTGDFIQIRFFPHHPALARPPDSEGAIDETVEDKNFLRLFAGFVSPACGRGVR